VWTIEQTATFLGLVANDRLTVMWWLIALRGLRRGEVSGLRWADVDRDARVATIEQQRIAAGRLLTVGPPKTAASRRLIVLDRHTVRLLRDSYCVFHQRRGSQIAHLIGRSWRSRTSWPRRRPGHCCMASQGCQTVAYGLGCAAALSLGVAAATRRKRR
jgi:integrase